MPDITTRSYHKLLIEITLVLLLAAATRLINSSHWPVWTDEGWSIWAVRNHDFTEIVNTLAGDRHPPAYFLALSAWSSIAGNTRIALRFLSIAIGLLTVAVIYRIGRDWFGHRAAIYAALLLSVLTVPVYYSQEVRNYGLLALSSCLMTLCFLRYLRHSTPGRLVPYILSATLVLYTHNLGLAVLGLQILFALLLWRGGIRYKLYLVGAWAITFIFYLPWLPTAYIQLTASSGGFDNRIGEAPHALIDFVRLLDRMFDGQFVLLGSVYILGLVAFRRREQIYIALSGIGLYIAFFILSQKINILGLRTLLFLIPMLVLICGRGFQQIKAASLRRLLISLTLLTVLIQGDIIQARIDADVIAQEVAKRVDSSDLVVLEMGWDNFPMQYELQQAGVTSTIFMPWLPRSANSPDTDVSQLNDIRPLLSKYRRILVLNWTQPPSTIPLLEDKQYGYQKALDFDISIGEQLSTIFEDRTVQTALFEHVDSNAAARQFGDLFTLHDFTLPNSVHPGETIFVDLWWSAATKPNLDYSVGTYIMDAAQHVIAQNDGQPGDLPTSQWQSGNLYFDRHSIMIPSNLAEGTYQVAVSVYWFGDQHPLSVDGNPFTTIGQIAVTAQGK